MHVFVCMHVHVGRRVCEVCVCVCVYTCTDQLSGNLGDTISGYHMILMTHRYHSWDVQTHPSSYLKNQSKASIVGN